MAISRLSLKWTVLGAFIVVLFLLSMSAAQAAPDPERPVPREAGDTLPTPRDPTTILPMTNPMSLAAALDVPAKDIIEINLLNSDTRAFGRGQSSLGYHFPLAGSEFLIMSTGQAVHAESSNAQGDLTTTLGGLNNQNGHDLVQLDMKLKVPPGVNCASFDFAFYSEEFPEYVGSQFNDAFTAEFGGTNLSIVGSTIVAPLNFAFDAQGNLITVNTVSGVTAPTNSTYDGKTPLRRAQVGVTPNEEIRLVFSIQDLGDSLWDSAVFLDNFFWSNNASCGGFVEPVPQPISALQLHMVSALPTGAAVRPKATVTNLSQAPTAYTLVLELRQGFGLLDSRSYPLLLEPGKSFQQQANFGQRGPGVYVVRANLFQGTELLETTHQKFTVGGDYLNLKDKIDELTKAAHQELNSGRDMAVEVLSKAVSEVSKEAITVTLTKVTAMLGGLDDSMTSAALEEASSEIYDWILGFTEVIEYATGDLAGSMWRSWLEDRAYNDRHGAVTAAADALKEDAEDKVFTWFDSWDSDVAHYRSIIESQNEAVAVGYGIDLDAKWPFYHRTTLVESKGQFFFLIDKLLPTVDKIFLIVLVGLIVASVVLFIISVVGTGGLSLTASGLISTTIPSAWASFKTAGLTKSVVGGILIALVAMLVGLTATNKTAVCVVDEHGNALDDFAHRIGLDANVRRPMNLSAAQVRVDAYTISVEAEGLERTADTAPIYTQLFRGDGQLLAYNRVGAADGACQTIDGRVSPGPYWAVVTSADAHGRSTVRQAVEVTAPTVGLTLTVGDSQLEVGEKLSAQAQVTNLDAVQGTGQLTLALRVLPLETIEMREFDLGPGQSRSFNFEFMPQEIGSYIIQAHVSDEEFLLAAAERGAVVGSGPALSLNVETEDVYDPGADVIWNALLENSGNQAATTTVEVNTFERSTYTLSHEHSMTVSLNPGGQQSRDLQILPAAEPGVYTTYILLDGVLRFAHDFLVTADGALFVTVEATPQFGAVGQAATITAKIQNESYAPINATVEAQIITPTGNVIPVSMQLTGQGVYQGSYTPSTGGTYPVRIVASKPAYRSISADTYLVVEDASLLVANMTEQLVLGQTTAIDLIVENEGGAAIPGATVVLSSTVGIQVEHTDINGIATFLVYPHDEDAVGVSVEKAGFAQTSLSLPIAVVPDNIPPNVIWLPPALTNEPTLAVSGKTEPGAVVEIQNKPVLVEADGRFTASLQLHEGSNNVSGTASDAAGNQTGLEATIILDTVPPGLSINWPEGSPDEWGQNVEITGQTDPGMLVTVRGITVTADEVGHFSIWIPPSNSPTISATATDQAGNTMTRFYGNYTLFLHSVFDSPNNVPPPPTLTNGNFEAGRGIGWQEYSSNNFPLVTDFSDSELTPHSGVWLAWLGGVYDETSILSQLVTVPAATPVLSYYQIIQSSDACGNDRMIIRVGGSVVAEADLCRATQTGSWGVWERRSIDLSSRAGQTVLLEFVVTTNDKENSNLFIDDVSFVSVAAAQQPEESVPAAGGVDYPAVLKER